MANGCPSGPSAWQTASIMGRQPLPFSSCKTGAICDLKSATQIFENIPSQYGEGGFFLTIGSGVGRIRGCEGPGATYQEEKSPPPYIENEICDAAFEYTNRLVLLEGQGTQWWPCLQLICHAVPHFQLFFVMLKTQRFIPTAPSTTVRIFSLLA